MASETGVASRKLGNRHVQFIAIGGAIGAGLFVGSGEVIQRAGPTVIVAYAICGFIIFLIARALGELAIVHPDVGGFSVYASRYIGDWAGFITGWSYWLNQVLVVIAELTAVSYLVRFWTPVLPQWLPGMIALGAVWLTNLATTRVFGEAEFWITLVKVMTIVVLILVGAAEILAHRSSTYGVAGFANLWRNGGFFPHGVGGLINVLPLILFAYGGIEVIGVAAAEMEAPQQLIPRAINGTVLRILLFYVGSLTIVLSLVPWTSIHANQSPFVMAFGAIGVRGAAALVNFVVLTAVLSACNTGVFATSRVLRGLALAGQAPRALAAVNARGVPTPAIIASGCCMLGGVALNYLMPEAVLSVIMRADAALMLWIWLTIVWAHFNYRRGAAKLNQSSGFAAPLFPAANFLVAIFIGFVCLFNFVDLQSSLIFLLALGWFGALGLLYRRNEKRIRLADHHASLLSRSDR
jgi:L-asparagine transporter-like permease